MIRSVSLLCFVLCCCAATARSAVAVDRTPDQVVRYLSGKYLNYYCSTEQDSALQWCARAESLAMARRDYDAAFQAQQLAVNALCLKGDISLGIERAGRMYDQAKELNSPLGTALAIQAVGAAYMYAGQYRMADETFQEAEPLIQEAGDSLSRLHFMMQQLHVSMCLHDTARVARYTAEAEHYFESLAEEDRADYRFYLSCYRAVYKVWTKRLDEALRSMELMETLHPADGFFDRWFYYVRAGYYAHAGEGKKALAYSDSTLSVILRRSNMSQYVSSLNERALLLEGMGLDREACEIYRKADLLNDSLGRLRYGERINALHTNYWVDRIAIENVAAHNKLLSSVILYAVGCLLFCTLLIVLAKRKNRQLVHSRLKLARAREAAEESIQSKSMFLSNMSHELRTPLNAIVGFSGLLTEADEIDAETKTLCRENIEQNAELLIKLVNDVVDFSDLREAKIKLDLEHCDAVVLCRNVIETVDKVKQTAARLSFSSPLQSLELYTDKGRLQQVLINLLVNATKFTREGTITLTLNVDEQRGVALFAVEDTGCGIPPEKQARIFERFEKLHENVQGVGLGLSICQLILDQLGGRIWIDGQYTQGARFVFTHPLVFKKDEA